ncbi:MAG: hypothetical protein U9N61_07355 [Euryarchaeota archaeon]|nr:hypothetical protein [Euryarchaeota archaeon]
MVEATLNDQLKEIDAYIAEQKGYIEMAEAAAELEDNPMFIKVVLKGFLEAEAERIMGALVTPGSFDKGKLDILQEKLASIRHFKEYFKMIAINSYTAPDAIKDHEEYRVELLNKFRDAGADLTEIGE